MYKIIQYILIFHSSKWKPKLGQSLRMHREPFSWEKTVTTCFSERKKSAHTAWSFTTIQLSACKICEKGKEQLSAYCT